MTNFTNPVRVYLAGKIANHENDWRRHIVSNVGITVKGPRRLHDLIGDVRPGTTLASQESLPSQWRWDARASLIPGVDITGPFFIEGEGHDGQHGDDLHGVGEYGNVWGEPDCECGHCGGLTGLSRDRQQRTVDLCMDAIKSSDLVFVWAENLDTAYGTLAEIGYAIGVGKPVVAALPDYRWSCSERGDQWFAMTMLSNVVSAENPQDGLVIAVADMLTSRAESLCESPAEKSLYKAHLTNFPFTLTPQHKVGRYRLDFAIVDRKIAVEVDGLTYHNGQSSFVKDQQRQRDLQAKGWTVIRFAAKEALDDPRRCLAEIARLAA